jgi:hypothetical protein
MEAPEWRKFAAILFKAVVLPLFLMFLWCEFTCWKLGETMPDETAARLQAANPHLIWFAHRDLDAVRFKLIRVDQVRPDILVMGTSRACQFRSAMFHPYSFYNFSRVSWTFRDLTAELRHLPPGYLPKIIIFSLDYTLFASANQTPPPQFEASPWRDHLNSLHDVFVDLCSSPLLAFRHADPPTIGLAARISGHGFRQDGTETLLNHEREVAGRNPDLLKTVVWNQGNFLYADAMGSEKMERFEEFADLARSKGITLIGVQMPMFGPVVRAIEKDPKFGILQDFRAHAASGYFDRLGVIFFDYLDFPPYSDDYRYFTDSVHPTEAVYAAALLKMDEDPRVKALLPSLDVNALKSKLEEDKQASQHVSLYRDQF